MQIIIQRTVKKVLESGNEVSSHTWNHTYLPKLSAAQVREQEDKTANAIYKACGSKPVSVKTSIWSDQ